MATPRTRRAWSDIRDTDIRPLLLETTAAESLWTDADLLLYANLVQDQRALEMMAESEGWWRDRVTTNLVADQKEYELLEGVDGLERILIKPSSTSEIEVPLERWERWGEPTDLSSSSITGSLIALPTVRIVGELIYLEPPPSTNVTAGLIMEYRALPARLTGDASQLDLRWPSAYETLLVLDVVSMAFSVEDAQGNVDPALIGRMERTRRAYESAFKKLTQRRLRAKHYSQKYYLGD